MEVISKKLSSNIQAVIPISYSAYRKVRKALIKHGYEEQVHIDLADGGEVLDLQGIALTCSRPKNKKHRATKCAKREVEK